MKRLLMVLILAVLILSGCTAAEDRQYDMSNAAKATREAIQEVQFTPECISHLQSATLTWTLPQENREIVHVGALTDEKSLSALETLLRGAEAHQPADCFEADVEHELTLTRQDGTVIRLLVATDHSCILRAGEQYYSFEPRDAGGTALQEDNSALYRLFGAAV